MLSALNQLAAHYLGADAAGEAIAVVVEVRDVLHLFEYDNTKANANASANAHALSNSVATGTTRKKNPYPAALRDI